MGGRPTRSTVRGAHALRAVVVTVLATAVVPPAAAWWLNWRRVTVTTERVATVAERVRPEEGSGVVCGPGRLPDHNVRGAQATHAGWIDAAVARPESFGAGTPTDAWGRCFLANGRWILSAGPNGLVETPMDAEGLRGDDIGARIR